MTEGVTLPPTPESPMPNADQSEYTEVNNTIEGQVLFTDATEVVAAVSPTSANSPAGKFLARDPVPQCICPSVLYCCCLNIVPK